MHNLLLVSPILLLLGCTAITPSTIAALADFDPLSADPRDFAVAIDLPDGILVAPGSANLTLAATSRTGDTTQHSVILQETLVGTERVFAIRQSDIEGFQRVQNEIREMKVIDPDGTKGSLAVELAACTFGDGPGGDDTFDVSIRTKVDGPFLPLVTNAPVSEVLAEAGIETAPCPTP